MNAELKARWIAALRSGEFTQGRGRLHRIDTNAYCCLGVLCVVAGATRNIGDTGTQFDGAAVLLPDSVRCQAHFDRNGAEGDLMTMNDADGASFPQIAKWIEENL